MVTFLWEINSWLKSRVSFSFRTVMVFTIDLLVLGWKLSHVVFRSVSQW